ncbi:GtrA family protein [Parabacteroides sp. AD58]|uniref:GtrA family protein n=1 Tax=Parabacteroides absconsus TaxID=2951805 RepID=A0ABZ2IKS7_9BACT|nr:GtrA family protein [Parabacteroides sp. AD58]MCM6902910.1 GtrA family protein [Parabacteroides sp. AD58]
MSDWIKGVVKKICKKDGFFTFMRAQFTSQISSATDFLVTIVLAKLFDIYYVLATSMGSVAGGIVNCTINYYWTFKSKECKKKYVLIKYTLVWIGSICLNTWGVYWLTESIQRVPWVQETLAHFFDNIFIVSKVIVSLLVGWFWNYNLHRTFVYKDCKIRRPLRKKKSLIVDTEIEEL